MAVSATTLFPLVSSFRIYSWFCSKTFLCESDKFTVVKSVPVVRVCTIVAPVKITPSRFVIFSKIAPFRFARVKSARVKVAPVKSASTKPVQDKSAPVKSAPEKFASANSEPEKFAPCKF